MSDQQVVPQANEQIVEQKRVAWGKVGVAIYNNELNLQLRAQQITATLVVPTEFRDIPAAEATLRAANQAKVQLEEERKKTTSTLYEVISRLMQPEKTVSTAIAGFQDSLLKLKQKQADEARANQQKENEKKQVIEKVRMYLAEMNAAVLKDASQLISDSYKHALEHIPPEQIDQYISKVINIRFTKDRFTIPPPKLNAAYNTQQDIDALILEVFQPQTPESYIEAFTIDMQKKYVDYKLAWQNKEQALLLNQREQNENTFAIEQQKQQDVVAANVQAMAQTPIATFGSKELKTLYVLEMEETFDDANIVIMAYIANKEKCRENLRTTKWLTGFGIKQMIGALEKLKNEDDKFHFNGLKWKQEDKL